MKIYSKRGAENPLGGHVSRGGEEVEVGPHDQEEDYSRSGQKIPEGRKEGKGPHTGRILRPHRIQPQLCGGDPEKGAARQGEGQEGPLEARRPSPGPQAALHRRGEKGPGQGVGHPGLPLREKVGGGHAPYPGGPGEVRGDQAERRGEGEAAFGERRNM